MNETASVILHEAPEPGAQTIEFSQHIAQRIEPEAGTVLARVMVARRWLLRAANKQPFYIDDGKPRNGELDSDEDRSRFATWDEAVDALYRDREGAERFAGLGFALGPDGEGGYWQGIDFDKLTEEELLQTAGPMPGYVERSPSGNGLHVIGYGRHFATLGANSSRVEAYAEKRYFTFTGEWLNNGATTCLAELVETRVARSHGLSAAPDAIEVIKVDQQTVTELRSALNHMRSDDRGLWVAMGLALKELGDVGRGLWFDWSQKSSKHDPLKDAKTWDSFKPNRTGYQAVIAEAQRQGWVNPKSNAARLDVGRAPESTGPRELVIRNMGDVEMEAIDWLWQGWLPKRYITLLCGESGAGKSTVLADVTARVTTGAPWPGEPPEARREPAGVLWLGSEDGAADMTKPRLVACGGDPSKVQEIRGVMHNGTRNGFSLQDDVEAVRSELATAASNGVPYAMLVIDPVTSYLPGQKLRKVDINDSGQIRNIVSAAKSAPVFRSRQCPDFALVSQVNRRGPWARRSMRRR
jgi:hypothetical protein